MRTILNLFNIWAISWLRIADYLFLFKLWLCWFSVCWAIFSFEYVMKIWLLFKWPIFSSFPTWASCADPSQLFISCSSNDNDFHLFSMLYPKANTPRSTPHVNSGWYNACHFGVFLGLYNHLQNPFLMNLSYLLNTTNKWHNFPLRCLAWILLRSSRDFSFSLTMQTRHMVSVHF